MTVASAFPCRVSALCVLVVIQSLLSVSVLVAHGAYVLNVPSDSSSSTKFASSIATLNNGNLKCPDLLPNDLPEEEKVEVRGVKSSTRIVGGKRANKAILQSLVLLSMTTQRDAMCTGSLIAPRFVATAAHCVYDTAVQYAFVGGTNRNNGVAYSIKRIHVFPLYDTSHSTFFDTAKYDIAYIELNTTVQASIARFMKININPAFPKVGSFVRVAGYGETEMKQSRDYDHSPSFQLDMPVSKPSACNTEEFFLDKSRMFCAGYFNGKQRCSPWYGACFLIFSFFSPSLRSLR